MIMLHNGKVCLVVGVAEGYHFLLTLAESFWAWSLAVFNFAAVSFANLPMCCRVL
jgi:hypothetical protein